MLQDNSVTNNNSNQAKERININEASNKEMKLEERSSILEDK